jgi:hypothetical protein
LVDALTDNDESSLDALVQVDPRSDEFEGIAKGLGVLAIESEKVPGGDLVSE